MHNNPIKIGDVVSPKGDPYFYMTVVRIMEKDDGNDVECDYPSKEGGRSREMFPAAAVFVHENFAEENDIEKGYV